MNQALIITARTSSKRLPNKILKFILPNTRVIDIIIKRAKKTKLPVILATSKSISDDKLVKYVKKNYKIEIFRGSLENKVSRWYQCMKKLQVFQAAFVDGDDLAFDYKIYKKNIFLLKKNNEKPTIYKYPKKIICGVFTYCMNFKAVEILYNKCKNKKKVEILDNLIASLKVIKKVPKISKSLLNRHIRLTLDYKEDYNFFKILFKHLKIIDTTKNIVSFLLKHNEISKINFFLNKRWKANQAFQQKI